MSIVYFSIIRLPNMCFIKFKCQIPMNEENKHVWVQHVVDDVKKNKKKSANRALVWPCRAHRADHELSPTEAALRSSSAVLNLFMLMSSGQMVKIWISETDKHKYLFWPSGKLISFLS